MTNDKLFEKTAATTESMNDDIPDTSHIFPQVRLAKSHVSLFCRAFSVLKPIEVSELSFILNFITYPPRMSERETITLTIIITGISALYSDAVFWFAGEIYAEAFENSFIDSGENNG